MNKIALLSIVVSAMICGSATMSNAQADFRPPISPIDVGSVSINAGAGFGVPYNGSIGVPFGVKAAVNWGVASLGRGVITLGLSTGGSFSNGSWEGSSENTSRIFLLARGAWHYGWLARGLDLYGGLSSGFGADRFHYGDPVDKTTRSAHLLAGIFGGASYFLTPGFGFNAEAGDDITILQLGVVAKFH
ncbi:MAG TPA: hypothetical protein VFE32_00620 [Puia sp.]|jgi:hypothetical protein|nr:hypothetical protein [Puia sp.]